MVKEQGPHTVFYLILLCLNFIEATIVLVANFPPSIFKLVINLKYFFIIEVIVHNTLFCGPQRHTIELEALTEKRNQNFHPPLAK